MTIKKKKKFKAQETTVESMNSKGPRVFQRNVRPPLTQGLPQGPVSKAPRTLGTWPAGPPPRHMARTRALPTPLPPQPGSVPTPRPPSTKFPPNRPSAPRPAPPTPQLPRARGSGLPRRKPAAWGAALAWSGSRRAAAPLLGAGGGPAGSPDRGAPETPVRRGGRSRASRLTQQQRRPKCGRHRRPTALYPPRLPRPAAHTAARASPGAHPPQLSPSASERARSSGDSDAGPEKAARKLAAVYFQGPCLRHTRVCTRPHTRRCARLSSASPTRPISARGSTDQSEPPAGRVRPSQARRGAGRALTTARRGPSRRAPRAAFPAWALAPGLGAPPRASSRSPGHAPPGRWSPGMPGAGAG
nr:translation initiation factor IF-2-like [Oryctolagus cuniculus]